MWSRRRSTLRHCTRRKWCIYGCPAGSSASDLFSDAECYNEGEVYGSAEYPKYEPGTGSLGRMLGRSMSRLSMPRRRQRLAYEGDGDATAPLRSPSRPAPSKVKVALKTTLLAGALVASASGVFLGAQHFLPCRWVQDPPGAEPVVATDPPPAAASEEAEPVLAAAVETTSAPRPSAKVEPDRAPAAAAAHLPTAPMLAATPAPTPEPLRKSIALALPRDEVEGYLARGEQPAQAPATSPRRGSFFARAAEAGGSARRARHGPEFRPGIPALAPNLRHTAQSGGGGALARQGQEPGNDRPGKVKMC